MGGTRGAPRRRGLTIPRIAALLAAQGDRRRTELHELAYAVNAGMAGGKTLANAFKQQRGVPADEWDGDPDDRPLTDAEKVPYAPGEEDDWMRDFKASLPQDE